MYDALYIILVYHWYYL